MALAFSLRMAIFANVVILVLSAGCAREESETTAFPNGPHAPHTPQFSSTTGAAVFKIITEEFQPVEGAQLALVEVGLRATSNLAGEAYFDNLLPADLTLLVSAPGFYEFAREVRIEIGRVLDLRVLLARNGSAEPYSQTEIWTGKWTCAATVANSACMWAFAQLGVPEAYAANASIMDNWRTAIVEATTARSSALGPRGIDLWVYTNHTSCKACGVYHAAQASPWRVSFEPNITAGSNGVSGDYPPLGEGSQGLRFTVYPFEPAPGIFFTTDQKWNLFTSVFYGKVAPLDFTALADA